MERVINTTTIFVETNETRESFYFDLKACRYRQSHVILNLGTYCGCILQFGSKIQNAERKIGLEWYDIETDSYLGFFPIAEYDENDEKNKIL